MVKFEVDPKSISRQEEITGRKNELIWCKYVVVTSGAHGDKSRYFDRFYIDGNFVGAYKSPNYFGPGEVVPNQRNIIIGKNMLEGPHTITIEWGALVEERGEEYYDVQGVAHYNIVVRRVGTRSMSTSKTAAIAGLASLLLVPFVL